MQLIWLRLLVHGDIVLALNLVLNLVITLDINLVLYLHGWFQP